ncbi:arsenite methyltransferase-like [Styela clava]
MEVGGEDCTKGSSVHGNVKEYYGKTILTTDDIKTTACSPSIGTMRNYVRDTMKLIHNDVIAKFFGCGITLPECLAGMSILDLGSGSGRDCYVLAKLVGEDGFVTGIDMTDEQLEIAHKYIEYHRNVFGFKKSNVKFVKGYIENLKDAGIVDESVDVIISNCVISLCEDKQSVLQEAFRVLKNGGEFYFSDMYSDREPTEEMKNNEVLWGEGMGGALPWRRLFSLAQDIGFEIPRTVSARIVDAIQPDIKASVGDTKFVAVTYRLFKLPTNIIREPKDVLYKGEIFGHEDEIQFDCKLKLIRGIPQATDGDTTAILQSARFKNEFSFRKSGNYVPSFEVDDPFVLAASSDGKSWCTDI